jgi:deoxyribodipyrimidine photo-lyase
VAGANSSKKYYANQENINKYTNTNQTNTWLDTSYEAFEHMEVPDQLLATQKMVLETILPESDLLQIDHSIPTFIYTYYNLDPQSHADEPGNRVLLLDPDFFQMYPVSQKCLAFMLALGKNIPGLKIHVGSFTSLCDRYYLKNIIYKEHPLQTNYSGIEEARDWITEEVAGYNPSYLSYWKKVEKQLLRKYR